MTTAASRAWILVVEDDPGIAALETELLEDAGCTATHAANGKVVLETLAREMPTLMLLDYSLPDMNAIVLLKRLEESGLSIPPFIVTTGAGDEHIAVELMRRGAQNYLIKDHSFLDVLPGAIERALKDVEMARRLAKAEKKLQQAARVLEGINEAFLVTTDQHIITDVNPAFERITGYSAADVTGRSPDLLVAPSAVADGLNEEIRQSLNTQGQWEGEFPVRKQDSSEFTAWFNISRIEGGPGEPPSFVTLFSDISERKQAEADLRISAIAFESQEGMFVTDAHRVILRVNHAFTAITGYSAEEAIGQTPRILNSGRHDAAFFAAMSESLEKTGSWQGEIWNRRKNGDVYPESMMVTAVKDEHGQLTNFVATLTDITSRKQAEDEIRHLAFYDPLTRLPNRRLMLDRLQHALSNSERHNSFSALMLLDLDNFKALNDTLGHDAGDQLLVEAAARLEACIRVGDTVARLGGDEFVVILENLGSNENAAMHAEYVATKIMQSLAKPYTVQVRDEYGEFLQREHHCTASLGIALFGDQSIPVADLMKRADTAMYEAKAAGRDSLRFFDREMQIAVAQRADLESELRKAVIDEQFLLHFQPQMDAHGQVTGAEALIRWQHPLRGTVSPADFIPLAEETGLILPIGHWVLRSACNCLAAWAKTPGMEHLTLSVNVSARQFSLPDLVEEVLSVVYDSGAPHNLLKLELTESLLLKNTEDVIAKMIELKKHGIGFAMDDFGTGYSSLSYLKRLPLEQLKIDQSFVRDVITDPNDATIARTVIMLGQSLGLGVIAEGVENEAQLEFLANAGCHAYQGYLFSRPLPLDGFESFVERRNIREPIEQC